MAKKKTDDDDAEAAAAAKKKKMMIGGGLLAAGAVYMFVLKPAPPVEEVPDAMAMADVVLVEGEIIELPDMVINMVDEDVSYVRVGVALILEEGTAAADFEIEAAIAKDVLLADLSSRTADELRGAESKQAVKDELSMKVRAAYDDSKVVRVLFTALVMQ